MGCAASSDSRDGTSSKRLARGGKKKKKTTKSSGYVANSASANSRRRTGSQRGKQSNFTQSNGLGDAPAMPFVTFDNVMGSPEAVPTTNSIRTEFSVKSGASLPSGVPSVAETQQPTGTSFGGSLGYPPAEQQVSNPLRGRNSTSSEISQTQISCGDPEVVGLLTEEQKQRAHHEEAFARIMEMLAFDFTRDRPSPHDVDPSQPDTMAQNFEDDEDEGRRCSMGVRQTQSAAQVGTTYEPMNRRRRSVGNASASEKLSRAAVQQHSTEDDCWVIIRNKVYNLTSFQTAHPGGAWVIVQEAGHDATATFEQQHPHTHLNLLRDYCLGSVPEADRR